MSAVNHATTILVFYVEDELFLARIVKESIESRDFDVIMENDVSKGSESL